MPRLALICFLVFIGVPAGAAASPALTITTNAPSAAAVIPQGASRVPVLSATLRTSCTAPVTVTALNLRHSGMGDRTDILRVYIMQGGMRMSRGFAVRSDGSVHLPMTLPAPTIPACGTETLDAFADFSQTAGATNQHRFALVSAETGDGIVSGNVSTAPATITPHATPASATVTFLPILTDVSYGGDRTVARFLIKNTATADLVVHTVTLTNDGSATDADMRNLSIQTAGGSPLSSVAAQMTGRTVTLSFTPALALSRNAARLLSLHADVRASRTRTIRWILQEPSDIDVRETVRGK